MLIVAIIYTFGVLIIFDITLTLPGIAGIILTIGMAVDANVLVYEHISEEAKRGIAIIAAAKYGFALSYRTIFNANLTSLIAAILLYIFGVGLIKGFAVTFALGIIISMFTCFWLTKPLVLLYCRFVNPVVLKF